MINQTETGFTYLEELRLKNPLVHCMTNIVVANFQANGLLAAGASPIMADAPEEAADVAALSSCTLLNIGTLNAAKIDSMLRAGKSANAHGRPVILDPVGAGATAFRKEMTARLLEEVDIALIRGNAGEIAALIGADWSAKGVDAGAGSGDVPRMAKDAAARFGCIVAVTGETDFVTDGKAGVFIHGGSELMTRITGSGCLLSALSAAFLALHPENSLHAVAASLAYYKRAGERAAAQGRGPGDLPVHLLNELYALTDDAVNYGEILKEELA